jgi:hypothetical protein
MFTMSFLQLVVATTSALASYPASHMKNTAYKDDVSIYYFKNVQQMWHILQYRKTYPQLLLHPLHVVVDFPTVPIYYIGGNDVVVEGVGWTRHSSVLNQSREVFPAQNDDDAIGVAVVTPCILHNLPRSITKMDHLIELDELETGNAANQICTLQCPSDIRWSSHYDSICSLSKLHKPKYLVLKYIINSKGSGTSPCARSKATSVVQSMMSFGFVFIMHVMKELMGIIGLFVKKLQQKYQDIVNAIVDVVITKKLI